MKHFPLFISLLFINVLIIFSISCYGPEPDPDESPYKEEDRLTSWDHINQLIVRPDNWQRIASNTNLFQLGDFTFSHNSSYNGYTEDFSKLVQSESEEYNRSYGTFPAIDGSTVLLPMAAEFGWQFLDLSDGNTIRFFNFSTTHNAYLKLIGAHGENNNTEGTILEFINQIGDTYYFKNYNFKKQPDIIFATSPSAAELAIAHNRGVALTIKPVCYDSFVFITHIDNPVDNLTAEQIRGIYSGQITNWSEVGGDDKEITAFQRNPGSGSQTAMEEIVMNGIKMMDAPIGWYIAAMGRLVEFVAEYQNESNSIGYTFKYYVDRLYTNPKIKIIKIDDVEPNDNNVRNQTYPFVAPYNGVIRSADENGIGGKFLDWMLSEEGQRSISQAGYVSITQ